MSGGAGRDGTTARPVVFDMILGRIGPTTAFDAGRRSPAAVVLPLSLQET